MPRRRPSRLRADSRRFAAHHRHSRPGRLSDERGLLELAIHALPRKSSRELRALVTPLDLRILEHPEAVPSSDPPPRWWRCAF
ncbi:hypothetical protein [Streptomyces sp. YKOK-I1]